MGNKALAKREQVERMVRFPSSLYMNLKRSAGEEKRSVNAQVLVAVERYLEAQEK